MKARDLLRTLALSGRMAEATTLESIRSRLADKILLGVNADVELNDEKKFFVQERIEEAAFALAKAEDLAAAMSDKVIAITTCINTFR